MKLLLTGATGFVGRNVLLTALQSARYEKIFAPVRDEAKLRKQLTEEGFAEFPANVIPLRAGEDFEVPQETCEEVIHCAGVLFEREREAYRKVNVHATLRLIQRLKGTERILLVSSQSAGGAPPKGMLMRNEEHEDSPLTWYGESKREMENAILEKFPALPIAILRPPMILGPRDAATLPLFQMAGGFLRPKPAWHTKHYSWIAVGDLVSAFFAMLDDRGFWSGEGKRKFYVTSPEIITDYTLIATVAEVMGRKGVTVPVPQPFMRILSSVVDAVPQLRSRVPSLTHDRALELWQSRMVVDGTAFQKRFGWKAERLLPMTLEETWKWYLRSGKLDFESRKWM